MPAPTIFLSYVREDAEFANRLRRDLHEAGVSVWRDKESLQPAQAWKKGIRAGINGSDVFAVVVSKSTVARETSQLLDECRYASGLHGTVGKIRRNLPLSKIRSNKLVQIKIDAIQGVAIDNFFSTNRLKIFNEYNRIDFYSSYDDGFASLVGAAEIEAMRARRRNRGAASDTTVMGWRMENMPIHDIFIPPIADCNLHTDLASNRQLPDTLETYFTKNVNHQIELVRSQGRSVTINKGYAGRRVIIDKEQLPGHVDRVRRPRVTFEDADYRHQLMFSNRLDVKDSLSVNDQKMSIRDYLVDFHGIDFENFSWADLERIPFPQRFATGTGVIVKGVDEFEGQLGLVVGVRASQTAVRNPAQPSQTLPCTVSCAEGMLRPDDARPSGEPSTILTAARAMNEELGLTLGEDYSLEDIKLLALAYDSQRCQPVAAHFAELPSLSIDDVRQRWRSAKDRNEHNSLQFIPLLYDEYDLFMNDKWIHKGFHLSLFSNHQRFCAAVIGKYYFDKANIRG